MNLPVFCKDCMYAEAYKREYRCGHPRHKSYDAVTGNRYMPLCYDERKWSSENCGPDGKNFVKKEGVKV